MENLNRIKIGELSLRWALSNKMAVEYSAKMPSTNDTAKNSKGMELILADHQTDGRGRGQNSWQQEQPGSALISSWIFNLKSPPSPVLSPLVGHALFLCLKASFSELPLSLKAPNDLYLNDKKLAGILIENVTQGSENKLIIGVGLNVWHAPLSSSDCLLNFLPKTDAELVPVWFGFLDGLMDSLSVLAKNNQREIDPQHQNSLLSALNRFPGLDEPYLRVHSDGSLESKAGIIAWSAL